MATKTIREYKGRNLIDFPDKYTVIDLETTGFDPNLDEIIEVSAIKYEKGEEKSYFHSLVSSGNSISEFIYSLTGLSPSDFQNQPSVDNVIVQFLDFVGDSIVVGQNINFDINFIYEASMEILGKPFSNDFIDTMRIGKKLHPELRHHRLGDFMELYELGERDFHRAADDCRITQAIFEKQHAEMLEKYANLDEFKKAFKKHGHQTKAADITTTVDEFDETHPLYGKVCVFTGVLELMVRKEAMQHVVDLGGICGDSVTKTTNYLILGNNDYCKSIKGGKSSKHKKAEELKLKGQDIEIISENVFYDMIDM